MLLNSGINDRLCYLLVFLYDKMYFTVLCTQGLLLKAIVEILHTLVVEVKASPTVLYSKGTFINCL